MRSNRLRRRLAKLLDSPRPLHYRHSSDVFSQALGAWARSSVVEHTLHTGGVAGSIPAAPTMPASTGDNRRFVVQALAPITALRHSAAMLHSFTLLITGTMLSSPVAAAPVPPQGKWTVDFAEHQCLATRRYGSGDRPLTIAIKPAHSGGTAGVMLVNAWTKLQDLSFPLTIKFPDGAVFRTEMQASIGHANAGPVFQFDLPSEEVTRLRAATDVRFQSPGLLNQNLSLGSTQALFRSLDTCLDSLRRYWNFESGAAAPQVQATPKQDFGRLFSWSNYPSIGRHSSKKGEVAVRLLVDETGTVRDCLVIDGSGSPGLDTTTCQVFDRRVSYRPARDAAGKPMRSAVDAKINWRR